MSLKRVQWFAFSTLLGSLIFVGSAQATDGINRLISVTQLKAQDANDPPPPPPPPPPKTIIGQFWKGLFKAIAMATNREFRSESTQSRNLILSRTI